jgi:hypothetical protein
MPDTIFKSPELVRGSLPDSSGASAPTNIRWVGNDTDFNFRFIFDLYGHDKTGVKGLGERR